MRFTAPRSALLVTLFLLQSGLVLAAEPHSQNLVLNPALDEDNDNLRGERMSCPVRARVTYGQRDGMPDQWTFDAKTVQRVGGPQEGKISLQILPTNRTNLVATVQPYSVRWKSGASPLPPLRFSARLKGSGGDDAVNTVITLSILRDDTKAKQDTKFAAYTVTKTFPATSQWSQVNFDLPVTDIAAALKKAEFSTGLITADLALNTPKNAKGISVSDIALTTVEEVTPHTLVANGGFEKLNADGTPAGWSSIRKSLRYFGGNYYVWRDWFHFFGLPRGANLIDTLVVHSGKNSFRMNVSPGDDKHIESSAIPLKQTTAQRMLVQFEYNSYLLANLMVQVVDEEGHEIYGKNITPGSSGGWQTFRGEFLPRRVGQKPGSASSGAELYGAQGDPVPLKSCRIRIGAKGVNGSSMDDINEWINVNHAGVLWIDNVVLAEAAASRDDLVARGLKVETLDSRHSGITIAALDLGERLFGENEATLTIANATQTPVNGTAMLSLSGPYLERDNRKTGYAVGTAGQEAMEPEPQKISSKPVQVSYRVNANGTARITVPYSIQKLLQDWRSEYRVTVTLDQGRSLQIPLGTWSQQALVDVERSYAFPEIKSQKVYANLGVARKTLSKAQRLELQVRRARNNQTVLHRDVPNLKSLAGNISAPLPENFEGDSTNFLQLEFPLDSLPVHPQNKPTRDFYAVLVGYDAQGKELFQGKSPRFGRMEPHTEKLEAIRSVSIDPGNYLKINDKPFLCRGHLWMQQNFGPAPLARQNTEWKKYGFNCRAGIQNPLPESNPSDPVFGAGVNDLWSVHNMYLGSQMISPKGPLTSAIRADIQKWLAKPNVIGIHFVPWEGGPAGTPAEASQYADDIKGAIGTRPLWISAGWYAPAVNGLIETWKSAIHHDWFMPENNAYFQPSQLDKEILPLKKGSPCVLGTYPNVFNDAPYNAQRFEHWTEIIRGHTGYMQIGKPGDQTLMAGMNGELRHIESFLFSRDPAPKVEASPAVPHLVRTNASGTYLMATNAGPVIGGDWEWTTKFKDRGKASHTGTALWSRLHGYMQNCYSHWYKDAAPVTLKAGDRIVQYVFIPADRKIENVMLMVRGNGAWRQHAVWGEFNHQKFTDSGIRLWLAKDMHQMAWGTIDLGFCGPEGHSPQNPKLLQYTFTADQFRNQGALPKAGSWNRLDVTAEALGLVGAAVDGFGFVSHGDKVWWERTLLVRGNDEQTLCDGSVGVSPATLKKVRFNVAGLKAGTKVQVAFEEREITAGDGYFEDNLTGEEAYRNQWVGLYGDKLGETGYYGDGVYYNYNWGKVAARLYEIPR